MEKIDNFAIVLERGDAKYLTGESVTGHVELKISQQIKINFIKIQLTGEAQVLWTEESNDYTYTYSGRESLIRSDIVFVAKQGENDLFIDSGDHKYPFTISLPAHLPTSFEHVYGTIRYLVKATIDMPSAFLKSSVKETKKPILVVNNLDLNELQSVRQPYGVSGTKIMCCGPCKSEPIMTYFSVNKTGYVSGEELVFNVYLDNKSNNEIKTLTVDLVVQMKFRATNDVKICRRTLKTVKYTQRIGARENIYWNTVSLTIPPLNLPSTHRTCIITVNYFLLLSFRAAAITRGFSLAIPIKIGKIPLRASNDLTLDRAYSMMPPTYEKCVEEDNKNNENNNKEGNGNETNNKSSRPITARPPSYRLFIRPSPSQASNNRDE